MKRIMFASLFVILSTTSNAQYQDDQYQDDDVTSDQYQNDDGFVQFDSDTGETKSCNHDTTFTDTDQSSPTYGQQTYCY